MENVSGLVAAFVTVCLFAFGGLVTWLRALNKGHGDVLMRLTRIETALEIRGILSACPKDMKNSKS